MNRILIGTSSWTDRSLIEGGQFYPPDATSPEDRLRYYASQFPIVEIDSSYYGIPAEANAHRWVERTPPGFVFNVKAYRLFTLHQTPLPSLGRDVAAALGPVARKNVYHRDVPAELERELWRQFRRVLEVLRAGERLGAVHLQFAPWVAFHPESFAHIEHCRAMLAGFDVAVEFRNGTWFETPGRASRTLAFERELGLANVIVDEPQGIPNTIPAVWEVTNPALAVVRLHGRNHATWNRKGLDKSSERFDYDYEEPELAEIAGQVRALAAHAGTTHVLFNNNRGDQGQRGARTMRKLMDGTGA